MDTLLALNGVIGFLNVSTPEFDGPMAKPNNLIILSTAVTISFVVGIIACVAIIKMVHSTYLPVCQLFDYVLHWAVLSICYLATSVFIFKHRILIGSSARRFESIFNFNVVLLITLLTFDFCEKKRFSTIACSGHVYLMVAWSVFSVIIHDLSMVYQVAQSLLHCSLLFIIPIMWMHASKRQEPFYMFRLKILFTYTTVWIFKNVLLLIFCFWLRYDVPTALSSCNIMCTFLASVIIARIVYITCYKTFNDYIYEVNGQIQLLPTDEIVNV